MIDADNPQIEQFLNTHRSGIQKLMRQAQQEAGGHYNKLSLAARQRQAEIDAEEFMQALLSGAPDRTAIQQTVDNATTPTIPTDIVNMATAFDQLFTAFVSEQLQGQPRLAHEIMLRSSYVIARFRLSVSASQIDNLVRGKELWIRDPETPTA
jgi:hypothetical protein